MAHGSIGRLTLPSLDEMMEHVHFNLDPRFVWYCGRIIDPARGLRGCLFRRHALLWCLCSLRRTVLGIKDEEAGNSGGEAR